MTVPKQKRSLANVFLTRRAHAYYLGMWVILSVVLIGLLTAMLYRSEIQAWNQLAPGDADELALHLAAQNQALTRLLTGAVVMTLGVISLAVITTHRLAGPFIAIKRTIEEIEKGNTEQRLHFRDYDRLEDVEEAFNRLIDKLAERRHLDVLKKVA